MDPAADGYVHRAKHASSHVMLNMLNSSQAFGALECLVCCKRVLSYHSLTGWIEEELGGT